MECYSGDKDFLALQVKVPFPSQHGTFNSESYILHFNADEKLTFHYLLAEVIRIHFKQTGHVIQHHHMFYSNNGMGFIEHDQDIVKFLLAVGKRHGSMMPSVRLVINGCMVNLCSDIWLKILLFTECTPKVLATLMAVSSQFESIFSANASWRCVKLKYSFEGVGSHGKLGEEYKEWLLKDAGLPLINAIRVKHVSLRYSRLRILLGTLPLTSPTEAFWSGDFMNQTRLYNKNLILIVNDLVNSKKQSTNNCSVEMVGTDGNHHNFAQVYHSALHYLFPSSVIHNSKRMEDSPSLSSNVVVKHEVGIKGSRTHANVKFYRTKVELLQSRLDDPGACFPITSESFIGMHASTLYNESQPQYSKEFIDTYGMRVVGDDRLLFAQFQHTQNCFSSSQLYQMSLRTRAVVFVLGIHIHLGRIDGKEQLNSIYQQLHTLWSTYAVQPLRKETSVDGVESLDVMVPPVLVVLSIKDLPTQRQANGRYEDSELELMKYWTYQTYEMMQKVVQATKTFSGRTWYIQPMPQQMEAVNDLSKGFINSINWIIRAITDNNATNITTMMKK